MISDSELTYKVAFSLLKGATLDLLNTIADSGLPLEDFFHLSKKELFGRLNLDPAGIQAHPFDENSRREALSAARIEEVFMAKNRVDFLFFGTSGYPERLAEMPDPPLGLFVLGDADLQAGHALSVVGTRKMTPYGKDFTEKLISSLSPIFKDLSIVSGLAYGVDAVAHSAAIDNDVPTIAVVAHGLNMIYPAAHRGLAAKILNSGGALVSEYPSGTDPFRNRFLQRNRIVAGLSSATVVVESEIRGGAMSTASHALDYGREVLALPGRVSDPMSAGCNHLIANNRARLITSASELLQSPEWTPIAAISKTQPRIVQKSLFEEEDKEAQSILKALADSENPLTLDLLFSITRIPIQTIMAKLGELEFDGLVVKHPGNRFAKA